MTREIDRDAPTVWASWVVTPEGGRSFGVRYIWDEACSAERRGDHWLRTVEYMADQRAGGRA